MSKGKKLETEEYLSRAFASRSICQMYFYRLAFVALLQEKFAWFKPSKEIILKDTFYSHFICQDYVILGILDIQIFPMKIKLTGQKFLYK